MAQLSDSIEQFIKELMDEGSQIEVRRNELAQHFGCAPSQINYVLATRFSVDHGYIIESRRGGGGYVRIVRMRERGEGNLLNMLLKRVGNSIAGGERLRHHRASARPQAGHGQRGQAHARGGGPQRAGACL